MQTTLPSGEKVRVFFAYDVVWCELDKKEKWMTFRCRRISCTIVDDDDNILGKGEAICSPQDIFRKNEGRKVAILRATEGNLSYEMRKLVLDAYFNRSRGKSARAIQEVNIARKQIATIVRESERG